MRRDDKKQSVATLRRRSHSLHIPLALTCCASIALICAGCEKAPAPITKPTPISAPGVGEAGHISYFLALKNEVVGNLAISPDGQYACTISQIDGPAKASARHAILRAWDLNDVSAAREIQKIDPVDGIDKGGDGISILFDSNSTRLLFTRDDHTSISFWDFGSKQMRVMRLPTTSAKDGQTGELLAISPDGWLAISAGGGQDVATRSACVLDLRDKKLLTRLSTPDELLAAVFAPDNRLLLSAEKDGVLRWWNTTTWKQRMQETVPALHSNQLLLTSDGEQFYCDGRLHRGIFHFNYNVNEPLTRAALAPGRNLIAIGERPDCVALLLATVGSRWYTLRGCFGERGLAFTSDGRFVIAASGPWIYRWPVPQGIPG